MRDRRFWTNTRSLLVSALLLLPLAAAQAQDPSCLDAPDGTPDDAVCVVDGVTDDYTEIDTGIFVEGGDGDLNDNGIIDFADISIVLNHLNGTSLLSNEDYAVADVNGDGRVSLDDVGLLILRFQGVSKKVAVAQIESGYGMVDNDVFVVSSGVRTGIGTTNPTAALHVIGDVVVEGTITEIASLSAAARQDLSMFSDEPGAPGPNAALIDELLRVRGNNSQLTATIERQERKLAKMLARIERLEAVLALPEP